MRERPGNDAEATGGLGVQPGLERHRVLVRDDVGFLRIILPLRRPARIEPAEHSVKRINEPEVDYGNYGPGCIDPRLPCILTTKDEPMRFINGTRGTEEPGLETAHLREPEDQGLGLVVERHLPDLKVPVAHPDPVGHLVLPDGDLQFGLEVRKGVNAISHRVPFNHSILSLGLQDQGWVEERERVRLDHCPRVRERDLQRLERRLQTTLDRGLARGREPGLPGVLGQERLSPGLRGAGGTQGGEDHAGARVLTRQLVEKA